MIQGWYCKGELSTSLLGVKGVNLSCVIIAQTKSVTCWLEVFTTIFQNEISGYFLHGFQLQMGITIIVVIIFDSLYNIKKCTLYKIIFFRWLFKLFNKSFRLHCKSRLSNQLPLQQKLCMDYFSSNRKKHSTNVYTVWHETKFKSTRL